MKRFVLSPAATADIEQIEAFLDDHAPVPREGVHARRQFVEQDAERVQVGAPVDLGALAELLRRAVPPHRAAGLRGGEPKPSEARAARSDGVACRRTSGRIRPGSVVREDGASR